MDIALVRELSDFDALVQVHPWFDCNQVGQATGLVCIWMDLLQHRAVLYIFSYLCCCTGRRALLCCHLWVQLLPCIVMWAIYHEHLYLTRLGRRLPY